MRPSVALGIALVRAGRLPEGRRMRNLARSVRVDKSMRGFRFVSGLVVAGCLAAGCGPGPARIAAMSRPHPVAARWRLVSYHGVHIEVPAAWPVVDGMHAGLCGEPFPGAPEVLMGPDYNPAPACPAPVRDFPARDGVWLAPGPRPPGARQVTISRHVRALKASPGWDRHLVQVWYRHVVIEIGIGPDPRIARRILGSVGYTRGRPDSRDTGDCARAAGTTRRPAPARLARRLVIENGDITLDPARPADRPVMTPAAAWQQARLMQDQVIAPFERYQLLLVRYSAKYPASPGPDGTYRPANRDVLAWVIYATPRTPISGCGGWSLDPFKALTGQEMGFYGWSPGP